MVETARILRAFIAVPHDQRAWLNAWDLIVGHIALFLRGWESRGRRLPLSLFAGGDCYRDLAVVVMSELFTPHAGTGAVPLAEFLRAHVCRSDDELVEHCLMIIRKTARQNVHKLEQDTDSGAWNIRKNIRRTLRDYPEFQDLSDGRFLEWTWTEAQSNHRSGLPRADDTTIHNWVITACREAPKTPAQCRHVFRSLDADDRFRNSLLYYPLVKTFVAVLLNHEPPQETVPESVVLVRLRGHIRSASIAAAEETLANDLPHLAKLAGLSAEEIAGVRNALTVWLADWVEHLDNDSLREYLSEQLGEIPLPVYQKRFHYLWNTLTAKCRDHILKRVRRQIGIDYEA